MKTAHLQLFGNEGTGTDQDRPASGSTRSAAIQQHRGDSRLVWGPFGSYPQSSATNIH